MSESVGYGPTLSLNGGTVTGAVTANSFTSTGSITSSTSLIIKDSNGGSVTYGTSMELVTVSTSATTDSTTNLLPANSVVDAVNVFVVNAIPTAATFNVGDATTAARFASAVSVAASTAAVGIIQQGSTGVAASTVIQSAAAKVRLTPSLTPGTSTGQVRLISYWRTFVAPTS